MDGPHAACPMAEFIRRKEFMSTPPHEMESGDLSPLSSKTPIYGRR